MAKQSDFDFLEKNLEQYPEIKEAMLNPGNIDGSGEKIVEMNKNMTEPLLICDNPDIELPKVPTQINFIIPQQMRKSKEISIVNIRNDLTSYKKLYEKNSTTVNKVIDEIKASLKNLYNPIKSLRDDIKNYSNNFENSINQLSIPLKNGKKGLNDINYKKYPKDKQNLFLKDKNEVIKEIDNFLKEANDFYKDYENLNKATCEDINKFVERFYKLVISAKELITYMRKLRKAFEKASKNINDLKNSKKIEEALKTIREPIDEFYNKNKNIEDLLNSIKNIKIERINEMVEISNKIKNKIDKLEASSKTISEKITKIRVKYEEPEESLSEIKIMPAEVIDCQKPSNQIEEQGKEIAKTADQGVKDIKEDIDKVKAHSRFDLLFIMDITNGMTAYLAQLKRDLLKIISTIREKCLGIEIYLGFIGYKDLNDLDLGENYIDLDFTNDYESIKKSIDAVQAGGGGDIPEDLCGGLELGTKKSWKGKTRLAFLVTDAPCHGKKYHDLTGEQEDNYIDGDREGRNIEEYIEFFAKNEISLFCLKINSATDKMFNIFSEVYNQNKNKNSQSKFDLVEGQKLLEIITSNAISMFHHRHKLEIK
jgi:myosin protein heavy chain